MKVDTFIVASFNALVLAFIKKANFRNTVKLDDGLPPILPRCLLYSISNFLVLVNAMFLVPPVIDDHGKK
jgi:hypothetical protein